MIDFARPKLKAYDSIINHQFNMNGDIFQALISNISYLKQFTPKKWEQRYSFWQILNL